MEKAIIGKKVGMTQIFDEAGKVIPVTVIQAGPCTVVQKKTEEKDGYTAVQLGFEEVPEKRLSKPEAGHSKKAGKCLRVLKEFKLDKAAELNVGDQLTATVFALEVINVGHFRYAALFPCLLSALTANAIPRLLGLPGEHYRLSGLPGLGPVSLLQCGGLAVLAALASILFCTLMHQAGRLYKKHLPNQYIRAAAGAALVIALTLIEGSGDYNGAGGHIIELALEGQLRVPWAFALKMLFTALTLGAGFRGGEIVPALFIGSTLGCAAAPLFGLDPAFGAAVSMIALFCGVVNCPLASIFLSIELFGGEGLLFFALACSLSFLLSGRYSLYSSQNIIYSKLDARLDDQYRQGGPISSER